jgi:chromosome segregation ATPase
MSDRNIEQINHNLDQVLAIAAETTRNLTKLELVVQDFIQSAKPRLLSLETSREMDEEKLEELENHKTRLERAHLEHQSRIDRMDEMIERLDRQHLDHQARIDQMGGIVERLDRQHLDHQARIDRQDQLIELLTQRVTG